MIIRKKDSLVLDKEPTQGLHDTTITAEAKYSINFSRSVLRILLFLFESVL